MPTLPFSRVTAAVLVTGLVLVGCRTLGPEPELAPAAAATNSVPEEPRIRPLDDSVGRVVSVNVRLKFAVLDYTLYRLPAQGQLLVAERDGAAVGELRVNGPVQGTTLSADVLTGDIRAGDRTRPKR